jgi:hypothetical protein
MMPIEDGATVNDLEAICEQHGLTFVLRPPDTLIPPFLSGYRPDAIAVRPAGGGIIFVFKPSQQISDPGRIVEISRLVSQAKGWELKVVYMNRDRERIAPLPVATQGQIEARLSQAEHLAMGGHHLAAFLLGWSALEAAARLALPDQDPGRLRAFSALQVVQALASEGLLDAKAASWLREMAHLRNLAVHGDMASDIGAEAVKTLLDHVQATIQEMQAEV